MKFYKDENNQVFAYEDDGSQDDIVPENQVAITEYQANLIRFPPKPLSEIKTEKLAEIRVDYDSATLEPVEALGFVWDGGFDSAIKLDAAMRLSQAAGAPGVRFYDTSNVGHDLDFASALAVCVAVAGAFQTDLAKKQSLFAQVNAATSKTQVGAISW